MQQHVVAFRGDRVDAFGGDADHAVARAHPELAFVAEALPGLPEARRLAISCCSSANRTSAARASSRALGQSNRFAEAFERHRLEQVVDRVHFERAHGVFLIGGDEDDLGKVLARLEFGDGARSRPSPASGCRARRCPA